MVVPKKEIGSQGLISSSQGLGCMGLTWAYSPSPSDIIFKQAEDVFDVAKEEGVTFLSTAWIYKTEGLPSNHEVLSKAISKHGRSTWVIADKIGVDLKKAPKIYCQSPEELEQQIDDALTSMKTNYIDVVVLNRPDPSRDVKETCKALLEISKKGKFKYLGLSEATPKEIRDAHSIFPLTLIEQEMSLHARDSEKDILPICEELGITLLAYSPLGRGLLTGQLKSRMDLKQDDWRLHSPRFSEELIDENVKRAERLEEFSKKHGLTPAQVSLAWLHNKSRWIVPIPGTTNVERVKENAKAASVVFTKEEMKEIEDNVPEAVGDRYPGKHGQYNNRM